MGSPIVFSCYNSILAANPQQGRNEVAVDFKSEHHSLYPRNSDAAAVQCQEKGYSVEGSVMLLLEGLPMCVWLWGEGMFEYVLVQNCAELLLMVWG